MTFEFLRVHGFDLANVLVALLAGVIAFIALWFSIRTWRLGGYKVVLSTAYVLAKAPDGASRGVLTITATNIGRSPVGIKNWGVEVDGKQRLFRNPFFAQPQTLEPGHHTPFEFPLSEFTPSLRAVVILSTDEVVRSAPTIAVSCFSVPAKPKSDPRARPGIKKGIELHESEQHLAAIHEFERVLAFELEDNDKVTALGVLADSLVKLHRFSEAKIRYEEALEILSESGDKTNLAHVRLCLGEICESNAELLEARVHFSSAALLFDETKDQRRVLVSLDQLTRILTKLGDAEVADQCRAQAEALRVELRESPGTH